MPLKQTALDKVRRQLAGLAALIDLWWQEVWHDIEPQVALTPIWTHWVAELLLPLMYWQAQLSRTRPSQQKAQLVAAWQRVQAAFETHPLTHQLAPEVLAAWKRWAADHTRAFQRTSSAVEGRNGYLSQMHQNHRGLPKRRYRVWTVLHNFDCRAADGSTPASRLFRREFPDLFETLLSTLPDLPRPRQCRQALVISA